MMQQQEIETRAMTMPEQARSLLVKDDDSYRVGAELLSRVKAFKEEASKSFDPIIKKAHDSHKEALAQKKKIIAPIEEAERIVKNSMALYLAAIEKKKREEERVLRERALREEEERRLQDAILAEAEGDSEQAEEILSSNTNIIAPVQTTIEKPKADNVCTKTVWKFNVVDVSLIPNQFKEINLTAISSVVRAMKSNTNIPGIEVYSETQIVSR